MTNYKISFFKSEPTSLAEEIKQKKFLDSAMGRFMVKFSDSFDLSSEYENSNIKRKTLRIRIKKKRQLRKGETVTTIPEPLIQTEAIIIHWQKVLPDKWSPSTRQQSTLTANCGTLYLIGGISRTISQDVHTYNIVTKEWSKLQTPSPLEARFGHTALLHNNSILIFGGGTYFNTTHKLRECLNGVRKLNLLTNQWTYLKTSGTFIQSRKGHICCIIGKDLFISGGQNEKQHILNDSLILDLQKLSWSFLEILNSGPLARAHHSACSIGSGNQSLSIYKTQGKWGIVVFGGIDSKKRPMNDLIHIVPGTRPVQCNVLEPSGRPPCPRFMHSMVICSNSQYLIVFGGRVDLNEKKDYTCFNDVHLLHIHQMTWVNVKVTGSVPCERSGHAAEIAGSEMFIFGGVSTTSYCPSEIFKLQISSPFNLNSQRQGRSSYFRHKSVSESIQLSL